MMSNASIVVFVLHTWVCFRSSACVHALGGQHQHTSCLFRRNLSSRRRAPVISVYMMVDKLDFAFTSTCVICECLLRSSNLQVIVVP